MEFIDKVLKCSTCGDEFIFSAGEQLFFREKQFQHEPKRCKKCKASSRNVPRRVETTVICSGCGILTTVPFAPSKGTPVFCRACFSRK